MLISTEHEISLGHKNKNIKIFKTFFMLNSAELAQLSWAWNNFQNFVTILRFINKTNFMLSWVEHEKSFITSGPGLFLYFYQL